MSACVTTSPARETLRRHRFFTEEEYETACSLGRFSGALQNIVHPFTFGFATTMRFPTVTSEANVLARQCIRRSGKSVIAGI